MKKSKLNLNDLKVESFVTNINTGKSETVKGGFQGSNGTICNSNCCSNDDFCFSRQTDCETIFDPGCNTQ